MNNSEQNQHIPNEISAALGIENYPDEIRGKIEAKFGDILFKRLLLLLPIDKTKIVIDEITALPLEEGMEIGRAHV